MASRRWLIDGNNVMGARPDGWWNDRRGASHRLTQSIAEWCRTHGETVVVVFDGPLDEQTLGLAGGNLEVRAARRRGRDAADHDLVDLAMQAAGDGAGPVVVVTSDRGLISRLPEGVTVQGAGAFRERLDR